MQLLTIIVTHPAPNILWLAVCAYLAAIGHLFRKIATVNKLSDGEFNYGKFFKSQIPYMVMSFCAISIALIAHENISRLQVAGKVIGDWMYLIFAFIGWASDSIMYTLFGTAESIVIKQAKKVDTDFPLKSNPN